MQKILATIYSLFALFIFFLNIEFQSFRVEGGISGFLVAFVTFHNGNLITIMTNFEACNKTFLN